jgi:hypothetical protein
MQKPRLKIDEAFFNERGRAHFISMRLQSYPTYYCHLT